MNMHLRRPTPMPRRQQHATPSTLVLHILCRIHHVRDTTAQRKQAESNGPGMRGIPRLKRRVRHRALPARRTIRGRRAAAQTRYWRRVLVHGAAGLLGWHAWLLRWVLGLHICALGVLRGRRAGKLLLLLLLLELHGIGVVVLLELRGVGILVVDGGLLGRLARDVGGDGVLLHWDTLFLHLDSDNSSSQKICVYSRSLETIYPGR